MNSGLYFDGRARRDTFTLDAAFSCPSGQVLGVLGPNGSGKTTLLSAIAGTVSLERGFITVGDATWDDGQRSWPPGARSIGVMSAQGDLFPHLSVIDNVSFGLRARGVARASARARAEHELELLNIAHLAQRRPQEVSSGQAQRAALARALITKPDVLLLDEPLSAVDLSGRDELRALLARRLENISAATLYVTHDPLEALTLADQLLFLEGGAVTQLGTPSEVVRAPRTDFAARVVGLNLVRGVSDGESVLTTEGARVMAAALTTAGETVFASFAPSAVSLWPQAPAGSPRNTWQCRVEHIEHTGTVVRVYLVGELTLIADLTLAGMTSMDLHPGMSVAATVKATDVHLYR